MKAGDNQTSYSGLANLRDRVSQPKAAEMLNVSPRTISTIKAVEREAPELIEKIEAVAICEAAPVPSVPR